MANKAALITATTQVTLVLGLQIYAPQTAHNLTKVRAEVSTVPVAETNLARTASGVCEHPPLAFVVLCTKSKGHRARCLECRALASERKSPAQAWRTLGWLSYRNKALLT